MSEPDGARLSAGSRLAVLASGGGTNLQALMDAYPEGICVVAGDRADALAFERARGAGIPVEHVDPARFASREEYDVELAERIAAHDAGLVVGAGYMRMLSGEFLSRSPDMINVHPSLLPDLKGLRAVERALEEGMTETGVTVHYVTEEVDSGPIISQERVPIYPDDTVESLLERIHLVEHRLLVEAVAEHFRGGSAGGSPG